MQKFSCVRPQESVNLELHVHARQEPAAAGGKRGRVRERLPTRDVGVLPLATAPPVTAKRSQVITVTVDLTGAQVLVRIPPRVERERLA